MNSLKETSHYFSLLRSPEFDNTLTASNTTSTSSSIELKIIAGLLLTATGIATIAIAFAIFQAASLSILGVGMVAAGAIVAVSGISMFKTNWDQPSELALAAQRLSASVKSKRAYLNRSQAMVNETPQKSLM